MIPTPNLELASSRSFLWPPIADALDTYLRRRNAGADSFERVWRLIHLWEATEISLATAALSRLVEDASSAPLFNRCREFFYGQSWNQVTRSFSTSQGAGDGSIDQWINILEAVAKEESLPGAYLPAVRALLSTEAIRLRDLAVAWSRACDAPSELLSSGDGPLRVGQAMRHVNSLRNRFAHVPFPHDRLADLADALELATEALFSTSPSPASHEKGGLFSALTGALLVGRCFLHGSAPPEWLPEATAAMPLFVVPCISRSPNAESWSASGFIFLDSMTRPHVLTRLKGYDVSEYTRFRAEANAVVVRPESGLAARIPKPTQAEYDKEDAELDVLPSEVIATPALTIEAALEELRRENYDSAIDALEGITRSRPQYHVAWLRLGHARREKALRVSAADPRASVQLLGNASAALEIATKHRDPVYQALAQYELSKVFFHLSRLSPDTPEYPQRAHDAAANARALSSDMKYLTWCDHLDRWLPLPATAQTDSGPLDPGVTKEGPAGNDSSEA